MVKKALLWISIAVVVVGSVVTALAISLGMVGILALCGFSIGPAVPSGFAAAGAAIYVAKHRH